MPERIRLPLLQEMGLPSPAPARILPPQGNMGLDSPFRGTS